MKDNLPDSEALINDISDLTIEEHTDPFENLPQEMVLGIFSFLDPKDLIASSMVSRRFRELANDPKLWSDKLIETIGEQPQNILQLLDVRKSLVHNVFSDLLRNVTMQVVKSCIPEMTWRRKASLMTSNWLPWAVNLPIGQGYLRVDLWKGLNKAFLDTVKPRIAFSGSVLGIGEDGTIRLTVQLEKNNGPTYEYTSLTSLTGLYCLPLESYISRDKMTFTLIGNGSSNGSSSKSKYCQVEHMFEDYPDDTRYVNIVIEGISGNLPQFSDLEISEHFSASLKIIIPRNKRPIA